MEVRAALRADARENRDRILAAARSTFEALGPQAPVREVARGAQVAVATVYRHFGSKRALVRATLATRGSLCSTALEQGLAATDPWDGFDQALRTLMRPPSAEGLRPSGWLSAAELEAERHRCREAAEQLLRRAQAARALRSDVDVDDLVLAVVAARGVHAQARGGTAAGPRLASLLLAAFRAAPPAQAPAR